MSANDFQMDDSFASFVQELEQAEQPKLAVSTTQSVKHAEANSPCRPHLKARFSEENRVFLYRNLRPH